MKTEIGNSGEKKTGICPVCRKNTIVIPPYSACVKCNQGIQDIKNSSNHHNYIKEQFVNCFICNRPIDFKEEEYYICANCGPHLDYVLLYLSKNQEWSSEELKKIITNYRKNLPEYQIDEDFANYLFNELGDIDISNNKFRETPPVLKSQINIISMKETTKTHLLNIIEDINVLKLNQIDKLRLKSLEIMENFFYRVRMGEFILHFNTKEKALAISIIYSALVSTNELPNISFRELSPISNINRETIRDNYNKYFQKLYPRVKFSFTEHRFKNINKVISHKIFNFINDNQEITPEEVFQYIRDLIYSNSVELLTDDDDATLRKMMDFYEEDFTKYFLDLINVIMILIVKSRNHRLLRANIVIKPIISDLESKGINLLQKTPTFYKYVREIYDYLLEKELDFFPQRLSRAFEEDLSPEEYRRYFNNYRQIIGYRLKLLLIKKFYDENGKCPECNEN